MKPWQIVLIVAVVVVAGVFIVKPGWLSCGAVCAAVDSSAWAGEVSKVKPGGTTLPAGTAKASGHQAVIPVHGLSCPLCAYGLKVRLDRDRDLASYQINIEKAQLTLVGKPGRPVDVKRYHKLIRDAGFTPGEQEK